MISIIVPVYNIEEDLPHCIDCILNSVYTDFEVILVNDGSTDRSGEICNAYCKRDKRCKVIHQKNQGLAEARNTGLKAAQGEYILFIDGDDYIHPEMIKVLYEHLPDDTHSFSMVYGKQVFTKDYPATTLKLGIPLKTLSPDELFYHFYVKDQLQHQVVWNKLYHRALIEETTFKKTAAEDTCFNNSIYLKTKQAAIIEEEMYYWYQRNTSLTHQPFNANYIDRINSYHLCLENIPSSYTVYRGYCLKNLYETILCTRYSARKTKFKSIAKKTIRTIRKQTFCEFIANGTISWRQRIIITVFLHFPFLYNGLRSCLELIQEHHPTLRKEKTFRKLAYFNRK